MRNDVIDAAVEVFWRKGVDHVTLADLEAAAGVDRSTLYNSFDGKAGLYSEAVARYVDATAERIFAPLTEVDDGLAAIAQMLERLRAVNAAGELPPGCLVVNDLGTPNVDTAGAETYYSTLWSGVRAALDRAVQRRAIDVAAADRLLDVVVAGILGANLTSRAVGRAEAVRALDALAATVRTATTGS